MIGDKVWYRSPVILGGGAIVLIVALNILFIYDARPASHRARPAVPWPGDPVGRGRPTPTRVEAARAANRFDIRRIIGGLFLLYGVILVVVGIVGSHHVKTKASGINIDLWAGLAMVIFGV